MESDTTVEEVTSIITGLIHPDKVILFGSRATGESREDSDYDFCVLVSGLTDERGLTRKINQEIYRSRIDYPVDIIAIDTAKFERNKDKVGFIYKQIAEKGRIVYGT